jgi:endonuclease YncB( thermonuclease family)
MKALISFWKKDWVNKLILLVVVAVVIGLGLNIYLFIKLKPEGLFPSLVPPTPRQAFTAFPTITPGSPRAPSNTPLPSLPPTFTQIPEILLSPTSEVVPSSPTAPIFPTLTPIMMAAATDTPIAILTTAPPPPSVNVTACIPAQTPEKGSVLEVLDGNTLRVLFESDGKVYTVRYIGIEVPPYDTSNVWGRVAYLKNNELTYAKPILMFKEGADKDARGRYLRYVTVGDIFVNFQMLRPGNATALASVPEMACAPFFRAAEESARQAGIGRWAPTPRP